MTLKSHFIASTLTVLILAPAGLCFAQRGQQTPPPPSPVASSPQVMDVQGGKIRVTAIATGLFHPWGIAFADANTILVTEQNGRLRIIKNGVLAPQPVWTSPTRPTDAPPPGGGNNNDALHFVAIHPDFAQNHLVYVSYPKKGEKGTTLGVARGFLKGDTLGDVQEIFVADAWETGGNLAGRVFFGKDKNLYVTIGDRDRICCNAQQLRPDGTDDNSLRMKSQSLDNHVGKTLRLRDDGTVPKDNPFVGNPKFAPEIFSYGHRNSLGLIVHPVTGELWNSENGPQGGDEINIVKAGKNYGWPIVSMGRDYPGPWQGKFEKEGMEGPIVYWEPAIAASNLMIYTGDKFPAWKNNAFIGAMRMGEIPGTGHLERIVFNDKYEDIRREIMLWELHQRIRDVRQGADGSIYLLTDEAQGALLKLEPAS